MASNKKDSLNLDIPSLVIKLAILIITVAIGLFAGITTSYLSFYIAACIQAINNMYDDSMFFKGYVPWITWYHIISFLGSLCCILLFFLHIMDSTNFITNSLWSMVFVVIMLSMPALYLLIDIYKTIREGRY